MVFNSFLFIMVFLPVLMIGWYGLNHFHRYRLADLFLIGMSLWFYGSFSIWNLPVLGLSIGVNYLLSAVMQKNPKVFMWAGVVFNLLLLGVFKYTSGIPVSDTVRILMPVGLSFYTFSQISFIIDRSRNEIGHDSLINYAEYVSYFPKLAEGPITFYGEIAEQFRDRSRRVFDGERFARGFILFVLGMAKKVLIADTLAPVTAFGFQSAYYLDTQTVLVTMIGYTFQLYFDFSGFIDMARGISQMLGIVLPVNFDAPLRQTSFGRFWKHWHSTLTRFLTKYVYIPLGGNRKGKLRTCLNMMAVFLISGLWHGNGWTYIVWGALTGLLVLAFNNFFRKAAEEPGTKLRTAFWRTVTFASFAATLAFFGAPRVDYGAMMFRRLFVRTWPGFLYRAARQINAAELYPLNKAVSMLAPSLSDPAKVICLVLLLILCALITQLAPTSDNWAQTAELEGRAGRRNGLLIGILFVWCLLSFSGVSTFLYFKF